MSGRDRVIAAWRYCVAEGRLRRTIPTALIVGTLLTLVNQVDVIAGGEATAATYLKCVGNYLIPFVVANVGLLAGRPSEADERLSLVVPARAQVGGPDAEVVGTAARPAHAEAAVRVDPE